MPGRAPAQDHTRSGPPPRRATRKASVNKTRSTTLEYEAGSRANREKCLWPFWITDVTISLSPWWAPDARRRRRCFAAAPLSQAWAGRAPPSRP